jgi:pimeloyl-ACP methyl ester carboxylesterase
VSPAVHRGVVAGAVTGVSAALAAIGIGAIAAHFARRVVTPTAEKPDNVELLGIGETADGARWVTLRATDDTVAPGRYGLWLDGSRTHARLGDVLDHDEQAGTVTRVVTEVHGGSLRPGAARWNQYYFAESPASVGLDHADVLVPAVPGDMPAWLVDAGSATWAVLVHGRGATREECLRALPVLNRVGLTSLVVSYRNDRDAPASASGRYHLGHVEWLDVEAAVIYALDHGAHDIVLVGWSMGAAISLQLLARSWTADRVRGVILDAPVLDWRDVLAHQARVNRVPAGIGRLGQTVLEHRHARRVVGLEEPVTLDHFDWVTRAEELDVPVLLIHSEDDEYVPAGPSRRLAEARPDLVTYVPFTRARHTREWNVDPERWDTAVARFVLGI